MVKEFIFYTGHESKPISFSEFRDNICFFYKQTPLNLWYLEIKTRNKTIHTIPDSETVNNILQSTESTNNETVPKRRGRPPGSTNKVSNERVERELRPRKK